MANSVSSRPSPRCRGSRRRRSPARRRSRSSWASPTTTSRRPTGSTTSRSSGRRDRFREANELRAFIEVEDGRIVDAGHLGQGHIGATTVRVGPAAIRFPAVHLPDIQQEPEIGPTSARFVQTVGGRMGLPTPRPVPHKPFVQFWPSIAWTTLALTINADGTSSHELVGASPFPRHWIYDDEGTPRREVGRRSTSASGSTTRSAIGRRGATSGLAGGRRGGRVRARALALVGAIMRGGAKPEDPVGRRGRDARRPGRGRAPRSS